MTGLLKARMKAKGRETTVQIEAAMRLRNLQTEGGGSWCKTGEGGDHRQRPPPCNKLHNIASS